ncbi:hypothetical protein ADUPG1_002086, partial [Aduncisulcus paluster]
KSVNGGDAMKVHVSRMRKFVSSSSKEEELASAMNDDREYRVEKVICHRGKGKRHIKFRVKWEGFPMEDNTWETFNDVKETSAFWDYVKSHKSLWYLIPEGERAELEESQGEK